LVCISIRFAPDRFAHGRIDGDWKGFLAALGPGNAKMVMKGLIFILLPVMVQLMGATAATLSTNGTVERVLVIDRALLRTSGAKAVLTIGPLQKSADTYAGDYQVKVSPYFFKSEKGRLAITLSAESLAKVAKGTAAEFAGTATTTGEKNPRSVYATVTPTDSDHGALKVWFLTGEKKMVFNTSYRFVEKQSAAPVFASSSD